MAEGKKKVIVYTDWISQFNDLTDEEAGRLIKHFFRYVNDLNPESDRLTELLFNPIKATLKRDLESWQNKQKINRENGAKGGRPKTQINPNNPLGFSETQNNPKKGVKDSVSVSVNDSVIDNDNKKDNKGVPPPFVDFIFHCREKAKQMNLVIDEDLIRTKFDAWLEGGWKDMNGKNILNWKAKISSNITYWQKKEQKKADTNFLRVYT
jgi:hypothetical protein